MRWLREIVERPREITVAVAPSPCCASVLGLSRPDRSAARLLAVSGGRRRPSRADRSAGGRGGGRVRLAGGSPPEGLVRPPALLSPSLEGRPPPASPGRFRAAGIRSCELALRRVTSPRDRGESAFALCEPGRRGERIVRAFRRGARASQPPRTPLPSLRPAPCEGALSQRFAGPPSFHRSAGAAAPVPRPSECALEQSRWHVTLLSRKHCGLAKGVAAKQLVLLAKKNRTNLFR